MPSNAGELADLCPTTFRKQPVDGMVVDSGSAAEFRLRKRAVTFAGGLFRGLDNPLSGPVRHAFSASFEESTQAVRRGVVMGCSQTACSRQINRLTGRS